MDTDTIDLGLTTANLGSGELPSGWSKRWLSPKIWSSKVFPSYPTGTLAVKLVSQDSPALFQRRVDIDIRQYPIERWKWCVENVLEGIKETTPEGDDHPIRLFLVFEQNPTNQSLWFKLKRLAYLDFFTDTRLTDVLQSTCGIVILRMRVR